MSRPLRIQAAGLTYHVTARGNGRMPIFLDEVDRTSFLELFTSVVQEKQLVCHADCQLDNHYHAVVTTTAPNISKAIQQLNGEYAEWWNERHGHVGHVFQGRFSAPIVQDDTYLLTVCRYVVLNPVRAGLVEEPGLWRWSSYRATANLAVVPAYLSPQTLWRYMGGGDDAPRRYREFVGAGAPEEKLPRDLILGDDQFQQQFAAWRERASPEVPVRERVLRPPLDDVFALAVTRTDRNAAIVEAFAAGYRATEVAQYLGVNPATVRRLAALASAAAGARSTKCAVCRPDPPAT